MSTTINKDLIKKAADSAASRPVSQEELVKQSLKKMLDRGDLAHFAEGVTQARGVRTIKMAAQILDRFFASAGLEKEAVSAAEKIVKEADLQSYLDSPLGNPVSGALTGGLTGGVGGAGLGVLLAYLMDKSPGKGALAGLLGGVGAGAGAGALVGDSNRNDRVLANRRRSDALADAALSERAVDNFMRHQHSLLEAKARHRNRLND